MATVSENFPRDFGRYRLTGRIAVGGMAELFKAHITGMEGFEKIVAIKKILPHLTDQEELVQAFVGEAKLAALLNHPNIVQIYEFGCINGGYFIAMEHLSGKDLSLISLQSKNRGIPVSLEHALYIVARVCEGLDYAHRRNDQQGRPLSVIHRDISPPNILVTYEGEVKIVDFGVAKAAGMNTKTRDGVIKGKVCYMSPEQASGLDVDHRSDLFSAGILLYEMATGQRMFTGDPLHTLLRVREADFQPAESIAPELPQDLHAILHRALAKDPQQRYQSAAEMLLDIEESVQRAGLRPSARTLANYMKTLFANEIAADAQAARESAQPHKPKTPPFVPEEAKHPKKTALMTVRLTEPSKAPPRVRPVLGLLLALGIVAAGFFTLSFTEETMSALYQRDTLAAGPPTRPVASDASERVQTADVSLSTPELQRALAALKQGKAETAAVLFRDLRDQNPCLAEQTRSPYAESLETWALSLKKQEPERATKLLEKALAVDPGRIRSRFELACLYTASGRNEKAIQTYEHIAHREPPIPEAVFNLAYLHAMAKDFAKAEALYRRLAELAPAYLDEVLFNLALVQEKQGKRARCVENLQKAVAFNPANQSARDYLRKMQGGQT